MENKVTYIIIAVVAIVVFIGITAVILLDSGSSDDNSKDDKATTTSQSKKENAINNETTNEVEEEKPEEKEEQKPADYYLNAAETQMADAQPGETIAVMHVKGYGDMTFKFFKDQAPKAVENFVTHSKEGYYNGVKFHRIIEEFMIQGGDPLGNGTGGESIWNKGFAEEFADELVPYKGSLCMASAGVGTSSLGSQFFIVQANPDATQKSYITSVYSDGFYQAYAKYGGYPSLYQNYTVFGQLIDGMDVLDKIAKAEVTMSSSGEMSLPVEDVIIESIEIKTK